MSRLMTSAAILAMGLASLTATASQTVSSTLIVNITLTSKCIIDSSNANVSLSYESFQTTAATSTGGAIGIKCTNTLPYTISLTGTGATDDAVSLAYTLSLSATSGIGSGATQNVTVLGTIPANQAGKCSTASCDNTTATNRVKTLTVTY